MEMSSSSFYVDIEYENFPNFCNFYKNVGHLIIECTKAKVTREEYKDNGARKRSVKIISKKILLMFILAPMMLTSPMRMIVHLMLIMRATHKFITYWPWL